MYKAFLLAAVIILFSCQQSSTSFSDDQVAFDPEGYEVIETGVKGYQRALLKDANGRILEEGYVLNGARTGAWIYYNPEMGVSPLVITSFVNGKETGATLSLNRVGQLESKIGKLEGQRDGTSFTYSFGKILEEDNYSFGKRDGWYRTFSKSGGKIQEVHFKNGLQDGPFRNFDGEGKMTIEYQYRNGERVGG